MSLVPILAAGVLGVAFVVAGASKIAVGAAWPAQALALGAPSVVVRPLPWIELSVGALLIVRVMVPVVASIAIALLVAFSIVIALRLREGSRPPCACFGAWSAAPIGPWHLVRNAALVALGLVAVLG